MRSACLRFLLVAFAASGGLCSLRAQDSADLLKRGAALARAYRSTEAESLLSSIGEKDPDYSNAQALLGYVFMRRSALEQAERAFQQALAANPQNVTARFGLGMVLSRRGSHQDAADQFERVFEDTGLGIKARSYWIQNLFWVGREDEALGAAQQFSNRFPLVPEYQSLLGFLSQVRGETKTARRAYERALELDPARLSDYYSLISICRIQKDPSAALLYLRRAVQLEPNDPLLYEDMASVYAELGLSQKAGEAREEARRTLNAELLYTQSARARTDGRRSDAEKLLRQCVQTNPRLSKAWTDLGENLRESNRPDEALHSFQRALEADPANRLARLGAAAVMEERTDNARTRESKKLLNKDSPAPSESDVDRVLAERERNGEAAAMLLRAVRDYPDNADLLAHLGQLQEASGRSQEASQSYSEALRIDPLQVQALIGKAHGLLAAGEVRRAISEYQRAAALEPSNMQVWRGLVHAFREAKDLKAAESACRQCLKRNPGDSDCTEIMAYLKLDAGDYGAAAELFQTVLRNGRVSKDIFDNLGFAHMKLGESREAIDLFEGSLKRYGPDGWVYFNLGYLYQGVGNIPSAISNYRRARQLSPQDPETNHNLAFALYLSKDYASALEPFRAAVRLRPDWGLAHFNLAMNYWNLWQYAQALTHARIAEEKGLPGAARVVQALSANLSLGMPKSVTVSRRKN
jgi:tetratricopeptide (TPR) repeat protein